MHIRHQRELLQQIADGLGKLQGPGAVRIGAIEVIFVTEVPGGSEERYRFGLASALDALANDIYWDERGNWSGARLARVEVI